MASDFYKIYRLKLQNLPAGQTRIPMYVYNTFLEESELIGEKIINVKPACGDPSKYIYLKYLSSDGQYRFCKLERIYTSAEQNDSLGKVSKMSTSFTSAQGDKYNIGYKTTKMITCRTTVKNDEFVEYLNLLRSPMVYLQKDEELSDYDSNWILVTVSGENVMQNKKSAQSFNVTITLPAIQNIRM